MEPLPYEKRGYLNEPFRLFHLADDRHEEIAYHYHSFHKIIMLLAGRAGYAIEGERYTLQPGDYVLVGRGSIHRPVVERGDFYERVILYISPEYLQELSCEGSELDTCFRQAQRDFRYVYHAGAGRVRELFTLLEQSQREAGFGAALLRRALFTQLMVEVNRVSLAGDTVSAAAGDSKSRGHPAIPERPSDGGAVHRRAGGAVLHQQVSHDAAVPGRDGLHHPRLSDGKAAAAGTAASGAGSALRRGSAAVRLSGVLHLLPGV